MKNRKNENVLERRYSLSELRVAPDGEIEGYAAVFNQLSVDLGGFREWIRPGAFAKTIREADIRGLFNHDSNYVLGRNKSGTLKLFEDDYGLGFSAKPPEAQWASDLRESIRRGDIDQASFQFRTIEDNWTEKDSAHERELIEVKLYDVSVVTFPAYPQTSVSARTLATAFIREVRDNADPEAVQFMLDQLARMEAIPGPGVDPHAGNGGRGAGPGMDPHPDNAKAVEATMKARAARAKLAKQLQEA